MGIIIVIPPSKKPVYDLHMEWDEKLGIMTITNGVAEKDLSVFVNEVEYVVGLDKDGMGQLQFDKSQPEVLYKIRIKDPTGFTKDRRLSFFY